MDISMNTLLLKHEVFLCIEELQSLFMFKQ